jgi:multidrug resistance efflux pump
MLRAALKALVAIIILAAGIGVFKLFVATKAVTEPEPASERSWNVSSVTLQETDTRPSILSFGTVQSSNMIDIRPSLNGRVEEVGEKFVEGGMITQGDLVVKLDRFDMEQNVADLKAKSKETDAQIRETKAELEGESNQVAALVEEALLVERDYERTLALSKRGATSTANIERAEIELKRIRRSVLQKQQVVARLEASVDRLQAISEQRKVALERADRDLNDTIINSPSTGFKNNKYYSLE